MTRGCARALVFALLALGALLSARAEGERGPRVVEVLAPAKAFRVTSRLLFVVDVSGSMTGEGERAISAVRRVLEGPSDELQAGVIAFADAPARWRGVPEPCEHAKDEPHGKRCVLPGWAAFPGRSKELLAWLRSVKPDGGTVVGPALRAALADRADGLTVILVSDGIFGHELALKALAEGQAERRKRKLEPAGVMVWAAGWGARDREALLALAKAGGGGLWAEED